MATGANAAQQRQRNQALAVLLLATIGLTFVGLLSVAGFTVMAQRRLRALGMIGAIGATDRQVRRVMLANGAAVGVVGSLSGVALGLVVWFALTPAFERVVGHRYDPFALPWWAVIAGAVLAILTALAASWWPARAVARLPIVAALSGRPAPPQPAHRFALLGTVLAAAGFVSLILAHARAHGADRRRHPGHHRRHAAARPARDPGPGRPRRPRARSRCAWRCATSPATRPAPAPRWPRPASPSASPPRSRSPPPRSRPTTSTLTGGNLPTNQLIVWLANPNNPGRPRA